MPEQLFESDFLGNIQSCCFLRENNFLTIRRMHNLKLRSTLLSYLSFTPQGLVKCMCARKEKIAQEGTLILPVSDGGTRPLWCFLRSMHPFLHLLRHSERVTEFLLWAQPQGKQMLNFILTSCGMQCLYQQSSHCSAIPEPWSSCSSAIPEPQSSRGSAIPEPRSLHSSDIPEPRSSHSSAILEPRFQSSKNFGNRNVF